MKTLQCRAHGGTFKIGPKRGRDPVNCGGKWPDCSRVQSVEIQGRKMHVPRPLTEEESLARRLTDSAAIRGTRSTGATDPQEAAASLKAKLSRPDEAPQTNPSIGPAMAAQRRLQPLGWVCKGRANVAEDWAELICARDGETIIMRWKNGLVTQQEYILWDEKPSANGKPAGSLTFNPDECTDKELVRALAGCKVTWWNVLGQKEEDAVIAPESIKIEHAYNGHGDETPGDRIVKFIEHGGAGYRAFRVAALLKVG